MADDRLRFILDFVAQTAGLKNAQELAEQLGTELTDAEDAGKQMAAALKAAADKADRELAETVALADKLGQALGPELTARVNVDEIASKMRQVGMTTADVEANIDDFRSSLTQMANTADQAKARMGDLDDGVRRVGDSTDRSRSVMANFTGNAMQELPMLSGAFGPLNMAIGQFAEYGAEGNISLKNMAAQAGPMAGIGAAIWYANNQLEIMKKKDAFHAERVKAYREAIEKSGDAVGNLADHLREVGKIEASTWGNNANPFADATVDITEKLTKAGFTVDQYAQLVEGGTEKIRAWVEAQKAVGNEVDGDLMLQIGRDAEDYAKAAQLAAENTKFFASTLKADLYGATEDVSSGFDRAGRAYDRFMAKFEKEDAVATAVLALGELKDKLADIQEKLKTGEITYDEALAEATLAFNGTTTSAADAAKALGFFSDAIAEKFEILIEQGDMDAALAKLLQLQRIAALMRSEDWFSNGDGPTATPGGTRVQTVDGERPVVVESTIELVVGGQMVQSITATQEAQRRGSR